MKLDIILNMSNYNCVNDLKLFDILCNQLNSIINSKNYGDSILEFIIGINILKIPKGFEELYKIKKPYYIENKIMKNPFTEELQTISKVFACNIEFIDEEANIYFGSNDDIKLTLLAQKIIILVKELKLPKKIANFNKNLFVDDVNSFLINTYIIQR